MVLMKVSWLKYKAILGYQVSQVKNQDGLGSSIYLDVVIRNGSDLSVCKAMRTEERSSAFSKTVWRL